MQFFFILFYSQRGGKWGNIMEKKITMNNEGKFLIDGVLQEDGYIGKLEDGSPRLFINGVAVDKTLKELGLREEVYAVKTERTVNEVTGEITIKATRTNGDIAITVLSKDGELIREKCKEIKA